MWLRAASLMALIGCGRIGFDVVDVNASDLHDGALPVLGPFDPPTPIAELNASCEKGLTLTADMLEMFWDSDRPGTLGGGDVWTSTRSSVGATWNTPTRVAEVSSAGDEDTVRTSGDGLTLYVASDSSTLDQRNQVYVATRASRGATWSAPVLVPEFSGSGQEYGPWVTSDRLTAVQASDEGGADVDIWMLTKPNTSVAWGSPALLAEVSSAVQESSPWLDDSGRILYFARNNVGLMVATRASPSDPFGTPTPVAELDTGVEYDEWLSPDLKTIVFSRNCLLMIATRP